MDADGSGGIDVKEAEMVAAFLSGQYSADTPPDVILSKMIIDNYDTNDDDKLSRDEAGDEVGANFDQIDANQDGVIDDPRRRKNIE